MSYTIPLVSRLLLKGRKLHQLGINAKALPILDKLARFPDLKREDNHEIHGRLAQMHAKAKRHDKARRHLAVCLTTQRHNAADHFRMAKQCIRDIHCDSKRVTFHFRQAIKLDPTNATYLSAFGVFALQLDRLALASKLMQQAFVLDPENAVVFRRYIRLLKRQRLYSKAMDILKSYRFRLGKLAWFQSLYQQFRFHMVRRDQRRANKQFALSQVDERMQTIPFPGKSSNVRLHIHDDEGVREDEATVLTGPHFLTVHRNVDHRQAQ